MFKNIKSFAENNKDLSRQAFVLGGTIVGGLMAIALTPRTKVVTEPLIVIVPEEDTIVTNDSEPTQD